MAGNKLYKDAPPAQPHNEHPAYQQWLVQSGYLKDRLGEACSKIATLAMENEALRKANHELSTKHLLPIGHNQTR